MPCPGNGQNVSVPGKLRRKGREGRGELYDAQRRLVQDRLCGGLVNFYALQRAVSSDIDRELQTAVNLAARFIWVMFGTEQLNLLPPGFDIASLRNRLRRWAH